MNTRRTDPYYCTLSQPDVDTLTELVNRFGYSAILLALGDILTQSPRVGMSRAPELSLQIGVTVAAALEVDRRYPPGASK